MIVSTDWLADYVDLSMGVAELAERLTLAGLNLEEFHGVTHPSGKRDTAIDVEVTSNRSDCLGHVGVAREVAVLHGTELTVPDPQPAARGPAASGVAGVTIECPDLCSRYTARVIRGVKTGPSPDWLADRLRTLGIAVINNVVDVTNYVLMEVGQPLHAFDLRQIRGAKLVVRKGRPGEPFTAIDHREYTLTGDEVVIADAERPLCLGGVMGGVDSEVTDATVDVLIESAAFAPLAVRGAARRHALHSPSSYRFERGVDPEALDWASRRCCELILELGGGELCAGVIDVGTKPEPAGEVKLRWSAIPRLLGIDVPRDETRRVLTALGCRETHDCDHCVKVVPPSWRADLAREVDLVEEVGRIHGYEHVPAETSLRV
ncbi:MAG: phenylalanine--tRNA ligase subunit beta, partial [Lacipirellulaceae bacterium]